MREMKDSGIEWIGDIPNTWEIVKGKYFLKYLQRSVKDDDGVITCFRDGEVTLRSNRREDGFTMSDKEIGYQGVDVGDLVVHGMDGFAGAIGISDSRGKASPVLNVLDTCQNKKYIMYYLRCAAYREVFLALATGIRVRSCDLRWNKLGELQYLLPDLKEQKHIIDFLDAKCAEIASLTADIQTQIDTLEQYKCSVITKAVTKGINSEVEMKDSEISYIGYIPKHWNITKLKYLGKFQNGISKGREYFGTGFPFVSYSDVYKNYDLPRTVDGLILSTKTEQNIYSVKYGDVFFTRTSETIEEIGFASTCLKSIDNSVFAGFLIRFRPTSNNLVPEFSKFYFRSTIHRKFFVKEMNLVTRASLGQNLLGGLAVLLPPVCEQKLIAQYLEKKCAEIDGIVENKKEQLEILGQYKKSIIYEYVTGKKEVPADGE